MTWIDVPADHPFGVANLPYGVFSTPDSTPRVGVRIGDFVLDVSAVAALGGDPGDGPALAPVWAEPTLNAFLAMGREVWTVAREWLVDVVTNDAHAEAVRPHLIPVDQVTMHLPIAVADYVDFYASEYHAANVGKLFRPGTDPLTPNWKHLPIGYHGRSGTVVVSGTDVVRPSGQRKPPTESAPVFGPSVRLDIEAELGFIVGGSTELGSPVSVSDADDHLFGVVLLNDWSARDLQAWEYVPLGPFLGKSFATTISPWVITSDALRAARVPLPGQTDPTPLPYLRGEATDDGATTAYGLDITYEVEWNGTVVSHPTYRSMYWSPTQMIAHMTVNGATLRNGDLFGSGTISGPNEDERGSFLELSWGGENPVTLGDGSTRTFLEDGDTVVLRATAPGPDGTTISLGECIGTIGPAQNSRPV